MYTVYTVHTVPVSAQRRSSFCNVEWDFLFDHCRSHFTAACSPLPLTRRHQRFTASKRALNGCCAQAAERNAAARAVRAACSLPDRDRRPAPRPGVGQQRPPDAVRGPKSDSAVRRLERKGFYHATISKIMLMCRPTCRVIKRREDGPTGSDYYYVAAGAPKEL